MHFGQKGFPLVIEISQQPRQMSVAGIEHRIAEMESFAAQPQQHGKCHFPLGAKHPLFWHASRQTTRRIVKPPLGNKQFAINQRTSTIADDRCKDADLTVLGLAQTAIPLPSHTSRLLAFLLQRRFVKDQGGAMAEVPIGILDQLMSNIGAAPS